MDAGGAYPRIEELLPLVDVLIPSEEFSMKVTGCATAVEAAKVLQEKYNPKVLVITQGNKGGFIWQDGKEVRYPVFPVKAIDSNGAGDTFHGAFVAAQLKGMSVYESCTFASATSALKCTRFGAQEGIPGYEEVLNFMKEHEGVIVNG
jgi:sulfofructose kinase